MVEDRVVLATRLDRADMEKRTGCVRTWHIVIVVLARYAASVSV
jgi:hypothetical protein